MNDLDLTEAIEAGGRVFGRNIMGETPPVVANIVRAAAPIIERQVREQVAERLRELPPNRVHTWQGGFDAIGQGAAMRIALGES